MNRRGFSGLEIFALVVLGAWAVGIVARVAAPKRVEKYECQQAAKRLRECGK